MAAEVASHGHPFLDSFCIVAIGVIAVFLVLLQTINLGEKLLTRIIGILIRTRGGAFAHNRRFQLLLCLIYFQHCNLIKIAAPELPAGTYNFAF